MLEGVPFLISWEDGGGGSKFKNFNLFSLIDEIVNCNSCLVANILMMIF
jgi:hypothetical protein